MIRILTFIVVLLTFPGMAFGGGPLIVTTDSTPVGWYAGNPVPYHTDQGGLGLLSNAEAVALADKLFGPWEAVSTATITFNRAGNTPVDIDETNFGPFLGPFGGATVPTGQNVIVFDADGAIFDTLFGIGTGVVGFASPTFFSNGGTPVPIDDPVPPGAKIIEGLAFLNGKFFDGIDNPGSGNFEISLDMFEAVFIHEFGHFAGLDHTQIHGLLGPPESDSPFPTQPVETMFPFLFGAEQGTLERDDVVAISVLYPTADFAPSTGRITGRILTSDGAPLSGMNVIARNLYDDSDSVSFVSGATIVPTVEFSLAGLTPGASYRVEVQEVDRFHTAGSRVGPFSPPVVVPGPPEFYNGNDESADPAIDDPRAFEPIIAAAGVTKSGIDIVLNTQLFSVANVPLERGSQVTDFSVGDFNRDGVIDFVAPQIGFFPGNMIRFYRGIGRGSFAAPVTIAQFPGNGPAVAGHFNIGVDNFLDIAVASFTLNEVRVYFGNGDGSFGPPSTILDAPQLNDGVNSELSDLAVGNVNGDPFPDLVAVVRDFDSGSATVYSMLGSASGSFTAVVTNLNFDMFTLAIAQFAGSSASDVIGIASFVPPVLGLLIGDGAGGFTGMQISLSSITNVIGAYLPYGQSRLAVGDFDENGTMDMAISDLNPVGGPPSFTRSFIDLLLGDGNGNFNLSDRYAVPEPSQFDIVASDFDSDGHLDIASTGALFAPGNPGAKVNIAFGDGAGSIRGVTTIFGLVEFPILIANLDGDLLVNEPSIVSRVPDLVQSYSVLLNQIVKATTVVNSLVSFNPIGSTFKFTSDTTDCPPGFVGKFSFDAKLTNKSGSTPISNLVAKVVTLTNGNLLLNADGGPGGVGATLTIPKKDSFSDGVLIPGESTDVHLIICLKEKKSFSFFVDVLGFEEGGITVAREGTDSLQVAESRVTNTESRRVKLRKGSRVARRGFFGRFRPHSVRNRHGH